MLQLQVFPQQEDYFLARFGGLVSVEAWDAALRELDSALAETKHDRLVVVLTDLVGWLGVPERTQVGTLMARYLSPMKKVALFIQIDKIKGVVETEARRQGLELKLFANYDDAVHWVKS